MQGAQILRNEAYFRYAAVTRMQCNAADGLFQSVIITFSPCSTWTAFLAPKTLSSSFLPLKMFQEPVYLFYICPAPFGNPFSPASIYNSMIYPLTHCHRVNNGLHPLQAVFRYLASCSLKDFLPPGIICMRSVREPSFCNCFI